MKNEVKEKTDSELQFPENPFDLTYEQIRYIEARRSEFITEYQQIFNELKNVIDAFEARSADDGEMRRELVREANRLDVLHWRSQEVRAKLDVLSAYLKPWDRLWGLELGSPWMRKIGDQTPPWSLECYSELGDWKEASEEDKERGAFASRMYREDDSITALEEAADALVLKARRAVWAKSWEENPDSEPMPV